MCRGPGVLTYDWIKNGEQVTASPVHMEIYEIKIALMDVHPLVWRCLQVQDEVTLPQLHEILQVTMGWKDQHLHRFLIDRRREGTKYKDFDNEVHDENALTLREIIGVQQAKFLYYEYDFGDGWVHELSVEKTFPPQPGVRYPVCVGGARRSPPEDCGGSSGYQELLTALQDTRHPKHREIVKWVGRGFDPNAFNPDAVSQELRRLRVPL